MMTEEDKERGLEFQHLQIEFLYFHVYLDECIIVSFEIAH